MWTNAESEGWDVAPEQALCDANIEKWDGAAICKVEWDSLRKVGCFLEQRRNKSIPI